MTGVAELHPEAILTPTKLELLAVWLPTQPWFTGPADDLVKLGRFRFVDPEGEVGVETLIVKSGGVTYQVPLTYRSAPLEDADDSLVGTMQHSVLGPRWVYDGVGDPVYVAELFRVIHEGDHEADLSSGKKTATAEGSGIVPVSNAAGESARIVRVLDGHHIPSGRSPLGTLTAHWTDGAEARTEIAAIIR